MRSIVSRCLHGLAHASGYSLRAARAKHGVHVLMLHGVGIGGLPTAALDRALAWLTRHFQVVRLEDLEHALRGEGRLPAHPVVLTFDDGLANNVSEALPVLEAHDVPATFFVCPGLIAAERWLWNHAVRARLTRLEPGARQALTAAVGAPAAVDFVEWMKGLPLTRREQVEAAVADATPDFTPSEAEQQAYAPMSRETLVSLDPARITIGSHTVDHPILPTLDEGALDRQLGESRSQLEAWLDRPVPYFCYPNGAEDPRVRETARRHYALAVTTEAGIASTHDAQDPHGIPRIGVVDRLAELAWRMHRP